MTEKEGHFQKLTKGALGHMLSGTKIKDAVVQLLFWEPVPMKQGQKYRVAVSDGIYYKGCIIIGPICSKISQKFLPFCLVKISRYELIQLQDDSMIVLLDLKLLVRGSEIDDRLGNPVLFGSEGAPPLSDFKPNYHLQVVNMAMKFDGLSLDDDNWNLPLCPLKPVPTSLIYDRTEDYFRLLTKGALGHMLSGTKIKDAVVQLLFWKSLPMENAQRYRLVLSDGIYNWQLCAIFGPICSKISKEFGRYSLLRIPRYLLEEIQGRTLIILQDLQLVAKGLEVDIRLGEPHEFGNDAPPLSYFPDFKANYHLQ